MNLSKSKIMAGYQCLNRLYLQVHEPTLADQLDEESRAMIEQGQEVGRLAQKMCPLPIVLSSYLSLEAAYNPQQHTKSPGLLTV